MALILAIEGDTKQAALLKCVVRNHVGATLVVVHSKDEAVAAIDAEVPDLILLSALLSPREEEEVVAHLRTLDRADHLQTLTIPRIAGSQEDEAPRGLLAAFRRKRPVKTPAGCDPKQFADQIVQYLERAEEIKAERAAIEEATGAAENTEPLTAEVAEHAEGLITEVTALLVTEHAASHAAPARRQAPLAMWAKAESADLSPREPIDQTICDEIRALMRSLRIPGQLADLSLPHGCRIRRVSVERRPPAWQQPSVLTRAIS